MIFNTINEYDNELNDIKSHLEDMEKRIKQYPNRSGVCINYRGLKEVYEIISEDRESFLKNEWKC